MKTLIIVSGTMGVGKTAVCTALKNKISGSVFLDGDWCWFSNPWTVNEETKAMVLDNIEHVLGNFLSCSAYSVVIFAWVLHEPSATKEILSKLKLDGVRVLKFSLVCTKEALLKRLKNDIQKDRRSASVIERSLERAECYKSLDTIKIDVSEITADEAAQMIGENFLEPPFLSAGK